MATVTPNFNWPVPTSTDLVKDGATAIEALGDSIDASLVDLKGGTTGQVLSKNSNTDMDFVWVTDAAGDITGVTAGTGISGGGTSGTVTVTNSMATAIDAKGDLVPGTGADTFARLAVGANGTVLTADSAETTGLKWAAAASGGGMTLLSTTTLSGASTTVSSISQDYKQLYGVVTGVTYTGSSDALAIKPNGVATGVDTCSTVSYSTTVTSVATPNTSFFINYLATTNSDSENACVFYIDNYTSTSTNKPMMSYGQSLHSGGNRGTCITWGGDRNNAAITSLEFLINAGGTSFTAGTVLLYGVK
jgi:hypothetical protein